ncbi:glutamate racemase [soil metagenome]|nr:glutamate racemase [Trueperaceae bacterium]
MPNATGPIGVFDSGVGGLSVLRALSRALPHDDFLYIGDTARIPYGSKPMAMVRGFAEELADLLVAYGAKAIVVACNTASAAALPALAERIRVPVWGVIEPGVAAALAATRGGVVGVLGTLGTIRSAAYQSRLERAGVAVWARACPLFVPIVEEGVSDTEIAALVARHYLRDRPRDLDTLILACTHYPALVDTLAEALGPAVTLVDSAETTAAAVASEMASLGLATATRRAGHVRHLVTGDIAVYRHTGTALGWLEGDVAPLTLAAPRAGVVVGGPR